LTALRATRGRSSDEALTDGDLASEAAAASRVASATRLCVTPRALPTQRHKINNDAVFTAQTVWLSDLL